jgi:hypothetical protein
MEVPMFKRGQPPKYAANVSARKVADMSTTRKSLRPPWEGGLESKRRSTMSRNSLYLSCSWTCLWWWWCGGVSVSEDDEWCGGDASEECSQEVPIGRSKMDN